MQIYACFPTLSNLSSWKSKKSFFKKMKLSDILKTSCESFSTKSQKLTIPETIYSISPRKLNKVLWTSFLVNKRKRLNSISGTKTNSVHLRFTTSLSMQEQSQDLSLLLLQGLDYLTLLSLWICWFCIISVFLSICFSSTFFLQISLQGLQEVASFYFSSCFLLVPFHELSKMISMSSRRYFKFFTVFLSYRLYSRLPDLLSYIPLLAIPLVIRMFFSIFHDMIDLRKRGKQISLQVV